MQTQSVVRALALATALGAIGVQLAIAQPALTDLHPATGANTSRAMAINDLGQVAGWIYDTNWQQSAVVWTDRETMVLLDPLRAFGNTTAKDINNSGQVVGQHSGGVFVWDGVNMVDVGFLTYNGVRDGNMYARAIGENGWAIGSSTYNDGSGWIRSRGWLFRNGAIEALTTPAGDFISPYAITPTGQILGRAYGSMECAVIWDNGTVTQISSIGDYANPIDINSAGEILYQRDWYDDVMLRNSDGTTTALHVGGAPYWDPVMSAFVNPKYYGGQVMGVGLDDSGRVFGWANVSGVECLWILEGGVFTEYVVSNTLMGSDAPVLHNHNDQMAGTIAGGNWTYYPLMWSPADGLQMLATLGGAYNFLTDFNNAGMACGFGYDANQNDHAFGWGLPDPVVPSALVVSDAVVSARNPKVLTVTLTLTNPGTVLVYDTTVTLATLDGIATNSTLPLAFGAIKPGASKKVTLQFKGVGSGEVPLVLEGTCTAGIFYRTQPVVIP